MPGLHAKKSPSGAKRLHACSGSPAVIESLPQEMRSGSGPAAKLGTISHFLLELCLREQVPPKTYEGRLIQIVNEGTDDEECVMLKASAKLPKKADERANTFEVDLDVILNVDIAYEYVERRCEELGVPMSKLKLEYRVNPVPDRDDTSGTADVTIDAWPVLLCVVDFKNGRILVEHNDNPQLLSYLAGMANELGWDYDEYEIAVVQPNGRHTEGKVRAETVTKERLLRFIEEHRAAAERADEAAEAFPGWEREPTHENHDRVKLKDSAWAEEYLKGGEHCGFCDASLVCPAYRAYKQAAAREEFGGDEDEVDLATFRVTSLDHAKSIVLNAHIHRTAERMARAFINGEVSAGRVPDFMKLVRKRGYRKWALGEDGEPVSPHVIAEALVKGGFISDNERARLFEPEKLRTGPQVEKLIPTKKRALFSAAFLYKPEGGLKLVLASDPGEAVAISAGDDFADDDEEEFQP